MAQAKMEDNEGLVQWMPICDDCDNPVEHYCVTCGDKLCTCCKEHHLSRRRSSNHKVLPYSAGMRAAKNSKRTCSKHPGERYQLYCKPCQTPVCTPCIAQSHADNDHSFMSIADAFSIARDNATSSLEKMTKVIRPKVKNYSDKIQKMNKKALEAIDNSEQEIRSTAQGLHEIVDLTLEENLKQLSEMKKQRVQPVIQKQERRRREITSKVEKAIKEYEDNLRTEDPIDLLVFMKGKIPENFESAFPIPSIDSIPLIKFNRASSPKEAMQTHLGSLTLSEIKVTDFVEDGKEDDKNEARTEEKNIVEGKYYEESAKISSLSIMKNSQKHTMLRLDSLDGDIAKLRHVNSDLVWVLSDRNKVVLVDRDGTLLRNIDIDCGISIDSGMCVSKENEVIFSDWKGKQLMKISRNFHVSTLFTTGNSATHGICQLQSGDWVVCMPNEGVLRVYDRAGKVIRDIGENHLEKPFYVIVNKVNNDICVSDNDKQIVVFNDAVKKRFSYTGDGNTGSEFNPRDLCCDKLGNILITDCNNHRVHIIDKDGNFLQYLAVGKENIYCPFTIDLDNRGYAWVGEWGTRKIKAYKYLQ